MPLSLKIPALVDNPLILAETRPQKISQFISKLPVSSPLDAAAALLEEIEILNRQKVAPDARIKALETYRPALVDITELLAKQYGGVTLPLSQSAKKHAAAAESLWLELGYGYKLALIDQQNKLFSISGSKATALVLQRAIEALSQLAMVYYQTYVTTPGSVWGDMNQLYFYAVQQSLQEIEVPIQGQLITSTISLAYKQALLMALADPQHLIPGDIKQVADYIARHARYASLQGLGTFDNPAGIFLVSLDQDKPPIPYVKNSEETDASSDILLVTIDLARVVHKHLQLLQTGKLPPELPANATDPRYQDMLTYLIKHWGAPPKRIFNRSRKSDGVELGIGITAAHYFLNGEQPYVEPPSLDNVTEISAHTAVGAAPAQQKIKASRWQVINISAGGMALRKFPNSEANVRVGDLLSIKNGTAAPWAVGVIRWASNDEQQIEIGAQLISPEAKAAGARASHQSEFEPVLMLTELPALKQAASIVGTTGIYSPARVLELDEDGKISRIMITKLVERTGSFERFQYSHL